MPQAVGHIHGNNTTALNDHGDLTALRTSEAESILDAEEPNAEGNTEN